MCDNKNGNPFAGLFTNVDAAVSFSSQNETPSNDQEISPPSSKNTSKIIKEVFGILLDYPATNNESGIQFVKVESERIEDGIFERLTLPDIESKLEPPLGTKNVFCDSHFVQPEVIPYLFECWRRLQGYKNDISKKDEVENLEKLTLRSVATALEAPEIFQDQEIHQQYLEMFMDVNENSNDVSNFTERITIIMKDEYSSAIEYQNFIRIAFSSILEIIYKEAENSNLLVFRRHWFNVLYTYANIEPLAKLLICICTPEGNNPNGSAFSKSILGAILSLSCLPKTPGSPFDFFDKPLAQASSSVDGNIWTALDALSESMHKIFHSLLKCSSETRHLTLNWIGKCLQANSSRGKLWNSQSGMSSPLTVSDGFMMNFGNILLRLCQPFCKYSDEKILKVDPTYCSSEPLNLEDAKTRGIHIAGMSKETCLIPTPESETRPVAKSFNFLTECFFLTHRALDLGYRIVLDKLMRTNQDLSRIQRLYNDAQTGGSSEVFEVITQRMEMEMTKYLSLRASLLAPEILKLLAKFHAATAFWLIQVNMAVNEPEQTDQKEINFAPKQLRNVTFPLPEKIPESLRCIPEFVVENTVGFVCFLKRLNPNTFEEHGDEFLTPILTEIIGLMESPKRLYNPHLRAQLAEGLESLLPTNEDNSRQQQIQTLGTFHRQQLFINHPHRSQIVSNLLEVFVSIEMTGQSVQFEQKFNYRRPMYVAMDYLWKIEEHNNHFKRLAREAEANMEAVQPPLFLRFINLLMNDAVFLLDEALSNMTQLKQMLNARENGDWEKLPQHERDQQVGNLQHIGMLARFDNILGRETISTMKMLTTDIKSIFCHPTMVDRIASMLNYLLLQLVGPNKRNLKVKDQKEYEFNPANLVLNICEIYINLGQNENFTLAVSQDGRSYRPDLFKLADNVLVRIGGVGILGDLESFSKRVAEAGILKREEEEILNDAPEEFLDPIMSTLMMDPVVLPSSKISVDRQTIARHLLSDQTDPFNRSPLTMDMVKSDVDLHTRIHEWIAQKKQT